MRIVWSLFAIEDREAIFAYIEADSPRAAARIDEGIEAQVELLASPRRSADRAASLARANW